MKTLSKLFQLLFASYLLSGCATPGPISRLSPIADQSYWVQGAEVAQLPSREGLHLEVSFLRSTPRYLIFEIGIQYNTGGKWK